jgi:protein TonB
MPHFNLANNSISRWLHYPATVFFAIIVSYGLFYFMHYLTDHGEASLVERHRDAAIEFIRLKTPPRSIEEPPAKPELPKPLDTPPPPPTPEPIEITNPNLNISAFKLPQLTPQLGIQGIGFSLPAMDGDATPLVRVQPQYPYRAARQGIEGWVEVEFSITPLGTVKNLRVVASQPAVLFDRAAMRAISRWKFKPRMVNDKPIARHQVRQRIQFSLEGLQ